MKSPTDEYANSGSASESMLSRLLSVDELLIRPTAEQAEESLFEPAKAPAARISLERFQELEQCIRNSPADPAPYLELAQIYIEQERWKDARRVLDQGCNHNPSMSSLSYCAKKRCCRVRIVNLMRLVDFYVRIEPSKMSNIYRGAK